MINKYCILFCVSTSRTLTWAYSCKDFTFQVASMPCLKQLFVLFLYFSTPTVTSNSSTHKFEVICTTLKLTKCLVTSNTYHLLIIFLTYFIMYSNIMVYFKGVSFKCYPQHLTISGYPFPSFLHDTCLSCFQAWIDWAKAAMNTWNSLRVVRGFSLPWCVQQVE